MRIFWLISGFLATGLAFIGVVLPLFPTVPFLLVATFCFARSSKRFHDWLVKHPIFGPLIENWREHGAIGRRAKWFATLSIGAAFLISLALSLPLWVLGVQALVLCCVLVFIWTRPEGA